MITNRETCTINVDKFGSEISSHQTIPFFALFDGILRDICNKLSVVDSHSKIATYQHQLDV